MPAQLHLLPCAGEHSDGRVRPTANAWVRYTPALSVELIVLSHRNKTFKTFTALPVALTETILNTVQTTYLRRGVHASKNLEATSKFQSPER